MSDFFATPVEFIKGVGPERAKLLKKELGLTTFHDLLHFFPFRYEDRTRFYPIAELNEELPAVQVAARLVSYEVVGQKYKQRLVVQVADDTGTLELVWFKGIQWVLKSLQRGAEYIIFGKPTRYGRKLNMAHPELSIATPARAEVRYLQPVYPSTETLKRKYLDNKAMVRIMRNLLKKALEHIRDPLPGALREELNLLPAARAYRHIHFPANARLLKQARFRLKFEELFYIQLQLLQLKEIRTERFRGRVFQDTTLLTRFYREHLPFTLTGAQKRVIREIYQDMKSGHQMNRLLQGDVGSGKTIVAFICMLLVISEGAQAALMAPTEILATQHYQGLRPYAEAMGLRIALLTGSTKASERRALHSALESGHLHILVGTHALLEERVRFRHLGLAIVDEQHRFGVAQRAKLWQKNQDLYPHVLVMTATPIPRTLAMTLYGDLDVSVIDELPAGRKPVKTIHRYDSNRLQVNAFLKQQIREGRQVYIVYPLIEESEKSDLKDLMDGYESVCRAFPDYQVSIVHGKMKPEAKQYEMARFAKGETQIMVATTVIEVGVDVPNATVMVIENAERFGLAQLHQLRGRVGRGAEQSYCILMSSYKLTAEARTRLETMVRTHNGFEIAETDLKLRGPGDLLGTQQSGLLDLKIANLAEDAPILQLAREQARLLLEADPGLSAPEHLPLRQVLERQAAAGVRWSDIS